MGKDHGTDGRRRQRASWQRSCDFGCPVAAENEILVCTGRGTGQRNGCNTVAVRHSQRTQDDIPYTNANLSQPIKPAFVTLGRKSIVGDVINALRKRRVQQNRETFANCRRCTEYRCPAVVIPGAG
jgi:hypothetical protein